MKIQCQSCQAKYTIADEKVLGKVVKIRCKKCSSTIVINGNEHQAQADGGDASAFDYGASSEPWTVNVADGDQRTFTAAELAAEYRAGVVNDETYCWKEGMADWLPLREIDALYSAVKGEADAPAEIGTSNSVPPPAAAPLFAAATPVSNDSPFAAPAHSNGNGNALFGGGAAEAAAPAAARRAGGRAQGADLFGNAEKAGGEEDVVMGGGGGGGAAGASVGEEKLTGQRNENSVLFSLSALTDNKPKELPNKTTATGDGSGLIDIRALSAHMDDGEKKKSTGARVDDIMNLSGGGAFGAALTAPILAPPPLEPVDLGVMASSEAPKQNKTLLFAILGGCAFIGVAIFGAVLLTRGPSADEGKTPSATGSAGASATAETSTAAPTAADPAAATAAAADDTPPPPGTGNNAGKTGPVNPGTVTHGATGPVHAEHAAAAAAAPAPAPEPPKPAAPVDLASAMAAAGGGSKPAGASGGATSSAPFNRGAAAAALGAVNIGSCKKAGGPVGSGHITVTFGPDGSVQSAVPDGGDFPGTPVGGCIAAKFRGAHVPAFSGGAVRVGKSFSL